MTEDILFPATVMPDDDWWHALWNDPHQVLEKVGIRSGMSVVDLCCGNGHFTRPLCELVNPGRVIGVDLDETLLNVTVDLCRPFDNFTPVLADARELGQLIKPPVDHVFIANTFHGVPDKTGLARAVHAVLVDGGAFSVVNWYPRPREETPVLGQPRGPDTALRMSPENVATLVEPAGFRLDRVEQVGPYHYGVVFYKDPFGNAA